MTGELSEPIVCGENIAKAWQQTVAIISLGKFLLLDRPQPTELFVPGDMITSSCNTPLTEPMVVGG
jgi:hypothetical protein